jgi:hypothetical protein
VGREESVGKGAKDVKKEKDMKEREMVEKVLRALDSDRTESRLSLKEVERIVRDLELVPGNDPKTIAVLVKETLSEARKRIREVLEGVRESLGLSSPLPSRLAKILEKGYSLVLVTPHNLPGHVQIEAEWDEVFLRAPSPIEIWPPAALVGSRGGDVAFNAGIPYAVFARRGRASFYSPDHENTKRAHEVVKAFRPLFRVFGLEDLEGAFEALTALKDGEARMEGAYVLARRGERWALRRGSVFGNLLLDKAFLLGEEDLVFSYPEGLKIAFSTSPVGHKVQVKALKVQWGEETASYYPSQYRGPAPEAEVIDEELPRTLIQMGLREWLGKPMRPKHSPRMEVLLRELSESENPLEAPKSEEFLRKVHLRALAEF